MGHHNNPCDQTARLVSHAATWSAGAAGSDDRLGVSLAGHLN
jgi:hypothetical protein